MNSLVRVLTSFRRYEFVFSADIESMFYQIRVNEEHKTLMRFLWWLGGDCDAEVREYAMEVHPF